MPDQNSERTSQNPQKEISVRYRGRGGQVWIYLGKLLRMFVYQNDWKVLPMSALIAGLVGLVIRRRMFLNMEGTLMGSFALVCVCIWNGCFNSIQVICRERDVIKRQHRSGMHISSYVVSHMIYQAMICLLQTVITIYLTIQMGVQYPSKGLFTPWLAVDLGITMMLITYASDMMSLWISAIAGTATTAMTIMPFVLIFQLVFSGGMLMLPDWTEPLTYFTISSPGLKAIAAHADVNHRPFVTINDMLDQMKDNKIELDMTVGEALDTLVKIADADLSEDLSEAFDRVKKEPALQEYLGEKLNLETTVGTVLNAVGEQDVKDFIEENAAKASFVADYEGTKENIRGYWRRLYLFIFVFALLAMITLEFIDKDKR